MILNEDVFEDSDVHIYMDDSTGNYYYYDGENLIPLGSKPQIGGRGNKQIQDLEDQQRQKQIEKEKEEDDEDDDWDEDTDDPEEDKDDPEEDREDPERTQDNKPQNRKKSPKKKPSNKSNDRDDNDDEIEDNDEESEESEQARLKRLQRIQDKLNNVEMGADISHEATDKVDQERRLKDFRKRVRERQIQAAEEAKKYKENPGLFQFKESLNKFIAKELGEVKDSKWSKINKKYAGTGTIKPGISKHVSGKIPVINVYYDRSGSWDSSMTAVGDSTIATLNTYVNKGKLKIYVYYFNDRILDKDPGEGTGGTYGTPILEHIKQTRPDNVIVMTDSDIDDCEEFVVVPGAVWLLFIKNRISKNLQEHLKGRKLTRSFELIV